VDSVLLITVLYNTWGCASSPSMLQVSAGDRRSAARPRVGLSCEFDYKSVSFQVCYFLKINWSISEKMKCVLKAIMCTCLQELTFCTSQIFSGRRRHLLSKLYLTFIKRGEGSTCPRQNICSCYTLVGLGWWCRFVVLVYLRGNASDKSGRHQLQAGGAEYCLEWRVCFPHHYSKMDGNRYPRCLFHYIINVSFLHLTRW
jgi:hypothetical protein